MTMRSIDLRRKEGDLTTYLDTVVKFGCGPNFVKNRWKLFRQMIKDQGIKFWFRFWLTFSLQVDIAEVDEFSKDLPIVTTSLRQFIHSRFVQATPREAINYCWNSIFQDDPLPVGVIEIVVTDSQFIDETYRFVQINFACALGEVFYKWLQAEDFDKTEAEYWSVPSQYLEPNFKPGSLEKFMARRWGRNLPSLLGVSLEQVPWVRRCLRGKRKYSSTDDEGSCKTECLKSKMVARHLRNWDLKARRIRKVIAQVDEPRILRHDKQANLRICHVMNVVDTKEVEMSDESSKGWTQVEVDCLESQVMRMKQLKDSSTNTSIFWGDHVPPINGDVNYYKEQAEKLKLYAQKSTNTERIILKSTWTCVSPTEQNPTIPDSSAFPFYPGSSGVTPMCPNGAKKSKFLDYLNYMDNYRRLLLDVSTNTEENKELNNNIWRYTSGEKRFKSFSTTLPVNVYVVKETDTSGLLFDKPTSMEKLQHCHKGTDTRYDNLVCERATNTDIRYATQKWTDTRLDLTMKDDATNTETTFSHKYTDTCNLLCSKSTSTSQEELAITDTSLTISPWNSDVTLKRENSINTEIVASTTKTDHTLRKKSYTICTHTTPPMKNLSICRYVAPKSDSTLPTKTYIPSSPETSCSNVFTGFTPSNSNLICSSKKSGLNTNLSKSNLTIVSESLPSKRSQELIQQDISSEGLYTQIAVSPTSFSLISDMSNAFLNVECNPPSSPSPVEDEIKELLTSPSTAQSIQSEKNRKMTKHSSDSAAGDPTRVHQCACCFSTSFGNGKIMKKCQRCVDENWPNPRYYCGIVCQTRHWFLKHEREHYCTTI